MGGWKLAGESEEGEWHSDVLVFDLSAPEQGWRSVHQPFERRALAAGHHQGGLVAIGGMDSGHEIDRSVSIFDPATEEWSDGPALPGEGMNGFGASAWNNGSGLFASGSNGIVYRLSDDGGRWIEAARLAEPRFFHQLVPTEDGDLLALGGASRKGHLTLVERVPLAD